MFRKFLNQKHKQVQLFAIADFTSEKVKLIVTYYYLSSFHIVFNHTLLKPEKTTFWFRNWKNVLLKHLIKKAETELGTPIKEISYNFPTTNLRIKRNHTYYHRFAKPVILTTTELNFITNQLLANWHSKDEYFNFSFHPQTYFLPDKQLTTTTPPTDSYITGLQIQGILYQANWSTINEYLQIFGGLSSKPLKPILLPYAIYINAILAFKSKISLVLHWTESTLELFLFNDHIFVKQHQFALGLEQLFIQLTDRFKISREVAAQYFYHTIQLSSEYLFLAKQITMQKNVNFKINYEQFIRICRDFLHQKFTVVIEFILKNWQLKVADINILLAGKITQINQIKNCLTEKFPQINLKLLSNNFVGLIDYNDHFLIGNAYYRHLQNKIKHEKANSSGSTT